MPLTHGDPLGHFRPQPPQFCGSVCVAAQYVSQAV
jgi:hypothetical protein